MRRPPLLSAGLWQFCLHRRRAPRWPPASAAGPASLTTERCGRETIEKRNLFGPAKGRLAASGSALREAEPGTGLGKRISSRRRPPGCRKKRARSLWSRGTCRGGCQRPFRRSAARSCPRFPRARSHPGGYAQGWGCPPKRRSEQLGRPDPRERFANTNALAATRTNLRPFGMPGAFDCFPGSKQSSAAPSV